MTRRLTSRFLAPNDIPALLELESRQLTSDQAADAGALRLRLLAHPDLCVGFFCSATGKALASLFMKPIAHSAIRSARRWEECAAVGHQRAGRELAS